MADTPLTITQPNTPLSLTFGARLNALIEQRLSDLGVLNQVSQTQLDEAIAADNVRDDEAYEPIGTFPINQLPPLP